MPSMHTKMGEKGCYTLAVWEKSPTFAPLFPPAAGRERMNCECRGGTDKQPKQKSHYG